jgi:hypothetical protein
MAILVELWESALDSGVNVEETIDYGRFVHGVPLRKIFHFPPPVGGRFNGTDFMHSLQGVSGEQILREGVRRFFRDVS